jgi:hypothetical protein
MKSITTSSTKVAQALVAAVLVLVPFHAFLTVWGSTLVGHYTLLRLWDDLALLLVAGAATVCLVRDAGTRAWFMESLLVRLIAAYAGLTILLGAVSLARGDVSAKALGYGLLVNLRFLAWFLSVLLVAQRAPVLGKHWVRLVLGPAAVVAVFGALQFTVLPHDFLAHFGYHAATTIAPIETINHNSHYIRVQSSLRGANPLGAYLVLIISAAGLLFAQGRRRIAAAIFGAFALFALYASGSRSAWIGTAVSLAALAGLLAKTRKAQLLLVGLGAGLAVLALGIFLLLRGNVGLQNAVLHTQDNSSVRTTSNAAHASAVTSGIQDSIHQPLGDGPGTAGPASEYNSKQPARIAEDYYVQLAQETGWLGLALFVVILALVGFELYKLSPHSPLALTLFVSLLGISFVNLLSHAWTDDTLAFLWWGLAGIALGQPRPKAGKREVYNN